MHDSAAIRISVSLLLVVSLAGFAVTLSGCGSTPYEEGAEGTGAQVQSGTPGTGTGGLPIPGDSSTPGSFTATHSFDFTLRGENDSGTSNDDRIYESAGVATDSMFRVRVIAGPTDSLEGGPGLAFSPGCLRFSVTVGGKKKTSQTLRVEGGENSLCPDAPTSEVFNFDDRTGGAEPLEVKISEPAYDFYCQLWHTRYWEKFYEVYYVTYDWGYADAVAREWAAYMAGNFNNVCPLRGLHYTHEVSGQIEVQTNGAD